jgi:hypothetical protein
MKRSDRKRCYFASIAILAAVNFAILLLLLEPAEKHQLAIPDETAIEPMNTARNQMKEQIDPLKFGSGLANAFAKMTGSLNSTRQDQGQSSGILRPDVAQTASGNDFSAFDHTAIGFLIAANRGKIPATGDELKLALDGLGDFAQLPIPFSAVALDSGLSHPRVVITQRPAFFIPQQVKNSPAMQPPAPNTPKTSQAPKTPYDLLGTASMNRPNLAGRLFLAANMVAGDQPGKSHVKTVEFISWNSRSKKFDFGIIEDMGATPGIKIVDGVRCFSCHKNKGPILGNNPWSNTTHNDLVRSASAGIFNIEAKDPIESNKQEKKEVCVDGMKLLTPRAAEVDAAIRVGADLLHNRRIFHALTQSPNGRGVLLLLFCTIIEPGSLEVLDNQIRPLINRTDLTRFLSDATAINNSVVPSRLNDFSPVGSGGMSWGCPSNLVALYDSNRAAGNHGLSGEHLPSNPKAFFRLQLPPPSQPSDLLSAVMLARTIGLTEGDRKFLRETLNATLRTAGHQHENPSEIARHVFDGPSFADILNRGDLPDRDDFKDRFVAGLTEGLKVNGISLDYLPGRDKYTCGPKQDLSNKVNDNEFEIIPTTNCLRCHDVRPPGKNSQFSPIPMLAFDPFDKASRKAWLATADTKRKEAVLTRMLKRIVADQDMPPVDSLEFKMFRSKDPASFDEVKHFLESELKKVGP